MLRIKPTNWQTDHVALSAVRRKVFIDEQGVAESLEWDEYDDVCHHILVMNDGEAVACGRIKRDGHIGRMAVLADYRGQGLGSMVLQALIAYALQQGLKRVYLHAQVEAIPFYHKYGFTATGERFMDAGIPHRSMYKELD